MNIATRSSILLFLCVGFPTSMSSQTIVEGSQSIEMLGSTAYEQTASPFSESGFNNTAILTFRSNIGEGGAFVFRCIDGEFLHFINPLGRSAELLEEQRLGEPESSIDVRVAIDQEVVELVAQVSPTGLSFYGNDLDRVSIAAIRLYGDTVFSFSFIGTTGEVINGRIELSADDKFAFNAVANNCGRD